MKKVLFYTNQFFGQIGGEAEAYQKPFIEQGARGNAQAFVPLLEDAEIVATIVCGDNYYAENMDEVKAFVEAQITELRPDLIIEGPAFNAGRFGIACADICKDAVQKMHVEAITGLYEENPAVEMYRKDIYILKVGKSAATMRKAVKLMAGFANKLLEGEKIGLPKEEGYYPKGKRVNVFHQKNGAERAMDMLLKKLKGEPYETELEISVYEKVKPAEGLDTLAGKKIALCTSGGIVAFGNPDHMPAATAKFFKQYSIESMDGLKAGEFESVHAGYDPVYANLDPNRVAPLDVLRMMEKEGKIGSIYPYLTTTTGNSTSVADATRMGMEIGAILSNAGVDGVILTST